MIHRHNKAASGGALAAGVEGVWDFLPSQLHCSKSPVGCQEQVAVLNLLPVLRGRQRSTSEGEPC